MVNNYKKMSTYFRYIQLFTTHHCPFTIYPFDLALQQGGFSYNLN